VKQILFIHTSLSFIQGCPANQIHPIVHPPTNRKDHVIQELMVYSHMDKEQFIEEEEEEDGSSMVMISPTPQSD